ncbi:hypothetical protein CXB51_034836 [Gossypium anomalum]|uniref:CAP-Gly domain-containing protein n=1 Tax=Gossypium anomalum TaxID=47600 RepID=A0A8J5Y1R8_9ROSI|nr:hypothetical protein CXB51_034836 [Gossypium anomalum]
MASRLQIEGDASVLLRVTHSNLKSFAVDIRFSLQMSVEAVKDKLWKKCGTSVNSMRLELYDDCKNKLCDLSDDSRPLGFYAPLDGFRIHIIDLDPSSVTSGGWLEDTSLVEKYSISEDEYNKRSGKCQMTTWKTSAQISRCLREANEDHRLIDRVGDRCEVDPGEKRGVVKYVGRAEALGPGFWIGVQYDEPLGKHDGIVKGTRYFQCPPLCGAMVRPDKVKLNHFSYPKSNRLVTILNEIPLRRMRYDVVAKGNCCIFCFHAVSITLQRLTMIFDLNLVWEKLLERLYRSNTFLESTIINMWFLCLNSISSSSS